MKTYQIRIPLSVDEEFFNPRRGTLLDRRRTTKGRRILRQHNDAGHSTLFPTFTAPPMHAPCPRVPATAAGFCEIFAAEQNLSYL